jgi:uncharacterized protein (DUF2344 family)
MDVRLSEDVAPEEFASRLNTALPDGLYVRNAKVVEETLPSLTALIQRARYDATIFFDNLWMPLYSGARWEFF